MYQTVGSNVTVGIAEALGKPIYRRRIGGKPRVTGLGYEGDAEEKVGDEVEDLYELVVEVLVCCGLCVEEASGNRCDFLRSHLLHLPEATSLGHVPYPITTAANASA